MTRFVRGIGVLVEFYGELDVGWDQRCILVGAVILRDSRSG